METQIVDLMNSFIATIDSQSAQITTLTEAVKSARACGVLGVVLGIAGVAIALYTFLRK